MTRSIEELVREARTEAANAYIGPFHREILGELADALERSNQAYDSLAEEHAWRKERIDLINERNVLHRERDQARAEIERLRRVVEAAREMHAKVWPVASNLDEVNAAVGLMQALAALDQEDCKCLPLPEPVCPACEEKE